MITIRKSVPKDVWTIIAPARGDRPFDFSDRSESGSDPDDCPFCPGNESHTPPETYAIREGDRDAVEDWSIRVFANKFPALNEDENPSIIEDDLFTTMGGFGYHEVVVETPDHYTSLSELPEKQIELVVWAYKHRYGELSTRDQVKYVSIFKNHGRRAGASLAHPHSQIMATPFIPSDLKTELSNSETFYNETGSCYYCRLLAEELQDDKRVLSTNEHFVALAPYASRFPFEFHIIPKKHKSNFVDISTEEITSLSKILQTSLNGLKMELGDFPYNFFIHTAPAEPGEWAHTAEHYHWHLEITPRITNPAGFEWGGGNFVNIVSPEDAVRRIKEKKN